VLLLAVGWPMEIAELAAAGLGLVAVVVIGSAVLAVRALRSPARTPARAPTCRPRRSPMPWHDPPMRGLVTPWLLAVVLALAACDGLPAGISSGGTLECDGTERALCGAI